MTSNLINPFISFQANGEKYFSVNPSYTEIFDRLGIERNHTFFRTDPYMDGLHADSSEDEPFFQFCTRVGYDNFKVKFKVKKTDLPKLNGQQIDQTRMESYLESLSVSVEYILDSIDRSNDWAKKEYKEAYHPHLKEAINEYRKTLK